ncbi:MAG: hypothetical protein JW762_05660 [Dehalococcoidales bacterium]|nr:hypothetical protein [Dehalococcoidales bacterium]
MNKYLLIIGALILVISIIGVIKSFTMPASITTQQIVSEAEYTQTGDYDYTVGLLPSYLYDDRLPGTDGEISHVPLAFIDDLTLYYQVNSQDYLPLSVGINVIIENPGYWRKALSLLPPRNVQNHEEMSFSVNLTHYQELGETLEQAIGSRSSSFRATLEAVVYDGDDVLFTHDFPLTKDRYYLELNQELQYKSGGVAGQFSYRIQLSENDLFDMTTITSPQTAEGTGTVLSPGDIIVSQFIDSFNLNYSYHLSSDQPAKLLQCEVKVDAILENPGYWSKVINLVPITAYSGKFTIDIPLDMDSMKNVYTIIQQETGIPVSTHQLTVQTTVRTKAETDLGLIDEEFKQSIRTELNKSVLSWEGDLHKSMAGNLTVTEPVAEANILWSQPVNTIRILSSVLAGVFLILLVSIPLYYYSRKDADMEYQVEAARIMKQHGEYIVEVKNSEARNQNEEIILVQSFTDLLKVSHSLLKPVHHYEDDNGHVYWVNDGIKRYEFQLRNRRWLLTLKKKD